MERLQHIRRLWFVCCIQEPPTEDESTSIHLKNLQNQQLPKDLRPFSEPLCTCVHIMSAFSVWLLFFPLLLMCTQSLNISGFTPNSMAPPRRQSSFLFSACYVSSIDVTSPDTTLGFLFRRYKPYQKISAPKPVLIVLRLSGDSCQCSIRSSVYDQPVIF